MDWLANKIPPLGAYQGFVSGHLISLNKLPRVRPVGLGETWRQFFTKFVLKFMGPEATHACKYDQSCMVMKAVFSGAVHGFQSIWEANSTK